MKANIKISAKYHNISQISQITISAKGAGTSEAFGQTKEKLCVNDILDIRKCSKADQIMGANKYSC